MSCKKYLGIDLGYHSVVSASSDVSDPFVVTVDANGLSNRSTPSIIGIENNRVLFGEEAETRVSSVPQKMVSSFPHAMELGKQHGPYEMSSELIHLDSSHLLSLFFKNFVEQVFGPQVDIQHVTIAVPVGYSDEQKQLVVDAALLSGMGGKFTLIDHLDAAMTLMYRDLSAQTTVAGSTGIKTVVVVDCGFRETAVGVMKDGEIVRKQSIPFGVVNMVHCIGDILFPKHTKNFQKLYTDDMKLYFRLFKVCEKILKDLSMLPTTVVDLGDYEEGLERNGIKLTAKEFTKSVTREQFEKIIQEENFATLLQSTISKCVEGVYAPPARPRVEIVGGGSRIPFIGKLISEATGVDTLGRSMDGSAFAALGSALWSAGMHLKGCMTIPSMETDAVRLDHLRSIQTRIESVHQLEVARLARKNDLESFLFQIKYWLEEDEKSENQLLPRSEIESALDAAWIWFEDNAESATAEELTSQKEKIKLMVEEKGEKFFEKMKQDKEKKEKSLTANAEYLSSHSAHETSAEKREKHSSAMSKDQALKLASRNKDEGNDLFKHGTVTDAMNRYLRAIGILAQIKRNECTGDEKAFVDSIALACNLNTAQCVIRMTAGTDSSALTQDERYGLLKRGIACADSALAIDPVNSKAKYRKAVCLERMKETEKAKQVIDEAMRENPDDDDLKKLYDSIVASLKEQQSKAKKFFSKMFQ